MPELVGWLAWPDLVFHVLAHARGTAKLAASVYDPTYVQFVERSAGPAAERELGEDAVVLGQLLTTHETLASVQLLAWLFDSIEQASAAAARDLGDLGPDDVAEPSLLGPLGSLGPAVEVLRCATELERSVHADLPACEWDRAGLERALGEAAAVAPLLHEARVGVVRSLRLRGRVRERDIWIGAPSAELGPDEPHVVWQACHEATVWEVSRELREGGELPGDATGEYAIVEPAAVVLLAGRARDGGQVEAHQRWLSHFGSAAPGAARESLDERGRALVDACRTKRG